MKVCRSMSPCAPFDSGVTRPGLGCVQTSSSAPARNELPIIHASDSGGTWILPLATASFGAACMDAHPTRCWPAASRGSARSGPPRPQAATSRHGSGNLQGFTVTKALDHVAIHGLSSAADTGASCTGLDATHVHVAPHRGFTSPRDTHEGTGGSRELHYSDFTNAPYAILRMAAVTISPVHRPVADDDRRWRNGTNFFAHGRNVRDA
ncbi:Cellulose synthase operon protein C [Rhodovastum atsumiense]|nr:Cellulose synthase operon protein C [Rhodovastum atsumiense]